MDVVEFVERSIGRWRSQRSGHNLAFSHFEEVRSTIDIVSLPINAPEVIELCKSSGVDIAQAISPFQMSWEGESDWDENETLEGSCVLVPIPNKDNLKKGKLLRSQGYAETIPAAGEYHITEDGTFILHTEYDRAAAEEKIWFGTPNLRFRVSLIKTSDGNGVLTASFSSEIRSLSTEEKPSEVSSLSTEEKSSEVSSLSTEEKSSEVSSLSTEEKPSEVSSLSTEEKSSEVGEIK